jgi:hypothetical protein
MRNITGLLCAALALAAPAFSSTIIFDNSSAHPGGTLTFGTASAPGAVVLSGGVIDTVTKIDGLVSSFAVTGGACGAGGAYGCLNFTTGSFIGQTTIGNTTRYEYNGGGSLSVTGIADGASGVLYSTAGFDGVVTLNVNNVTKLSSLSGTLGPGALHPLLAAALGVVPLSPGGTDTNSALRIRITRGTGAGISTTNAVQLEAESPVPEPASMLLIGSSFIGLGVRRLRARVMKAFAI